MPIYSAGDLNTSALTAPDLYVQVVPPRTRYINGVATDGLGLVGVASWGPVNSAFHINSDADLSFFIGQPVCRQYDLATAAMISLQVGASNLHCVRVTDGYDKSASSTVTFKDTGHRLLLKAMYSGSRGNDIQVMSSAGTAPKTRKLTIALPGVSAEVFDNIQGDKDAFLTTLCNAINNGQFSVRGPSQLIKASVVDAPSASDGGTNLKASGEASSDYPETLASAPASDSPPASDTPWSVTLSGGTDGCDKVTDREMLGTDGTDQLRKGLFALRGTNSQVVNLADVTDNALWSDMVRFARTEGALILSQGAPGTGYQSLSDALNASGVDDWHFKLLTGDWPYWKDTVNGIVRMIAPATFEAASIAAHSPHISTLNKRIPGVIATERHLQRRPYSVAEIGAINSARLDVITNPCPGGHYFGMRSGRNTSSNPTQNDDTYTRMTNFLSLTIAASFGGVVGENQTVDLRRETKSTLESFLSNLELLKMIGDPNGGPAFSVQLGASNNPDSRVALGYMTADVQVKYLNVVRYFLVNLEGGGSVSISVSNDSPR